MEYLQYENMKSLGVIGGSFKPCYKWNTFNTGGISQELIQGIDRVLNLVINGIPSIQEDIMKKIKNIKSFKPCYKWNTFNT